MEYGDGESDVLMIEELEIITSTIKFGEVEYRFIEIF